MRVYLQTDRLIHRSYIFPDEKDIYLFESPAFTVDLFLCHSLHLFMGVVGGAMVLGKLPVLGRPTIWMIVRQGPFALAVGADGGCLGIFALLCPFSPLSSSLWETV